jgi:hypothetical protein
MLTRRYALVQLAVMLAAALSVHAQSTPEVSTLRVERLELFNVKSEAVTYKGYPAVQLIDAGAPDLGDAGRLANCPRDLFHGRYHRGGSHRRHRSRCN